MLFHNNSKPIRGNETIQHATRGQVLSRHDVVFRLRAPARSNFVLIRRHHQLVREHDAVWHGLGIEAPCRQKFNERHWTPTLAAQQRGGLVAGTLLDDLTVKLAEFEKTLEASRAGRREHVEASADLEAVATQIAERVRMLDGPVPYRFGDRSLRPAVVRRRRRRDNT